MKIGIIGAMEVEVALLKEHMTITETYDCAKMHFCAGTIGATPVVVVQSGIAKVNAALCVQILVDHFQVTHVVNTGVAGSLDNALNIGDIVVSTAARYHDVDATYFGYARGEVPQMGTVSFPADPALRKAAVAAVKQTAPEISVKEGEIISGDQFISTPEKKKELQTFFSAACTEMEGAAIAQAAYLNGLPFVILRAISDKADESEEANYPQFAAEAARHCAAIVEYMVEHLK